MRKAFSDMESWRQRVEKVSKTEWSRDKVSDFFVDVYEQLYKPIPDFITAPETSSEKRSNTARDRAAEMIGRWCELFDRDEESHIRPSAWKAANAVTNYLDHETKVRMRKNTTHANVSEAKLNDKIFGTSARRKAQVMTMAGCAL